MRRIIFGLVVILGAGAAIATGATGAFFSDTETSTGNTFAAGAIDLKVDNDSYYNRNRCTLGDHDLNPQTPDTFAWVGVAPYPVPGTPCDTSFPLSELGQGLLFFNFTDLKPDDEGEDTISLHVQNDAWACMDVSLTSNDDRTSTEPELATPDAQEDINNTWDGELAQNLQFFWWADDGDNVYEVGENPITESNGVETLYNLATTTPFSVALADATTNVWNGTGPLPANQTQYIGKAWCFGTMTLDPVPAGLGQNPSVDPGVDCDGSALNNLTQTDGATVDVAFRTVQARNNGRFICGDEGFLATLTVTKVVTNDNGGNNVIADFQLFADNGVTEIPMTSGVANNVAATSYTVTETGVPGYVASFSGDCNSSGQITLLPGEVKSCTITNNDLPGNITLIKNVINDNGGTATSNSNWGLRIDGSIVPNNTSVAVTANTPHTITEDGRVGYTFTGISGSPECPAVLGGTATLDEGEAITCTITNDDDAI